MKTKVIFSALLTLLLVAGAHATVLTLQNGLNGYAGTRDTAFNKTASLDTFNYGGAPTMIIGSANDAGSSGGLLVGFDDLFGVGANQVSAGQTITSATLRLYCYSIYSTSTQPLTACPMHSGWVEGDANGTMVEGAACNMARHYRSDGDYATHPEDAWGTAGVTEHNGDNGPHLYVDYSYSDAALVPWPTTTGWIEWDVTTAVQDWQVGTLENNGWMVRLRYNQHSMHRCYSSEYADDASLRPQLVIEYVPEPMSMVLLTLGSAVMFVRKRRHA